MYGDFQLLLPEHETVFAYTRSLDGVTALVVLNFSTSEVDVDLGVHLSGKRVLLANYELDSEAVTSVGSELKLKGYESRVYISTS